MQCNSEAIPIVAVLFRCASDHGCAFPFQSHSFQIYSVSARLLSLLFRFDSPRFVAIPLQFFAYLFRCLAIHCFSRSILILSIQFRIRFGAARSEQVAGIAVESLGQLADIRVGRIGFAVFPQGDRGSVHADLRGEGALAHSGSFTELSDLFTHSHTPFLKNI